MKPVEKVSEIKTSKLGYILLTIMVFFIISVSQVFLSDITKIIAKPSLPSYCIEQITNIKKENLEIDICKKGYYSTTTFNETDKEFGLDVKYNQIITKLNPIFELNKQIKNEGVSLKVQRVNFLDKDPDISPFQLKKVKEDINELTSKRDAEYDKIKPELDLLKEEFQKVEDKIKFKRIFFYLADVFLQLLFILPIFAYGIKKYFEYKKNNSPYTVIATAVVAATSLLLLQVILGLLVEILPWGVFQKLWVWLNNFQFIKYIFYYGIIIATIGLFGGLVYSIQKSAYAPEKVAKRRILKSQCPNCESKIRDTYNNCRGCGESLKVKCSKCKEHTSKFFNHCSNCGNSIIN